jgi:glycosyltransferase involved in cell wall biosynthesis
MAVKSGGIPEIVSHGSNGFLLESRTHHAIQAGMESFLNNRDTHERAAEEGFRTVQEKFLLSAQLKTIENVLEECLNKR